MKYIGYIFTAFLLFTTFDHMMRVDQQNMCERNDQVSCPSGEWFWN